MKAIFTSLLILLIVFTTQEIFSQTNIFPTTGNVGIGTTSPATLLQVKGGVSRFGNTSYVNIDSAGVLTFSGNGAYKVAGNKYAFQYSGNPNFGLFFNSTAVQYEFRNGSAAPVFSVNANTGNSVFNGTLKIGAYTLPVTDGTNGQVLTTNGAGNISWSTITGGGSYLAGTGISITGNTIVNTAPDKTVSLTGTGATTVTGTYPNFTISSTDNNTTYTAGSGISITGNTISSTIAGSQWTTSGSNVYYNAGNVGIGTTAPIEKFSVQTGTNSLGISHTDGTIKIGTFVGGVGGGGYFGTISNHPLYFMTNNGAAQVTLSQNGNFGIGTTSPAEKLTVQTASGNFGLLQTDGVVSVGSYINDFYGGSFGTKSNHPLYFFTNNGGYQLALLVNGNFGVGTTTPQGKLDVNGDAYINGIRIGRGAGNTSSNVAIGYSNFIATNTGLYNVALGYYDLYSNTTGNSSVAIGNGALVFNTTGNENTAVGNNALHNNTTGYSNTAIGTGALRFNTTASNLVAIGDSALFNNTIGDENTAIGSLALNSNVIGGFNTAVGFHVLKFATGSRNTGMGTAVLANTTGGYSNSAFGSTAMQLNTSGHSNTAMGDQALFSNTYANGNCAFGSSSLVNSKNGAYNTAVGFSSFYTLDYGNYNTGLGNSADFNGAYDNCTVIGSTALGTASNQVRIGNSSVTSIGGYVGWSNISDGRVKKNIKENVPGLAFINKLKPITYNLDLNAIDNILKRPVTKDKDGKPMQPSQIEEDGKKAKENIVYTGFVAQDVEKLAKSLHYDFSGIDAAKNEKDLYGLRYAEFVVPLVKAVQELSQQNDSLKAANTTQQKINTDLQQQIDQLKAIVFSETNAAGNNNTAMQQQTIGLSSLPSLDQNIPNPFSNSTTINYSLPANSTNAYINFYDSRGTVLKSVKLSGNGKGSITLKTNDLPSGIYSYTLFINDKPAGNKQMVLAR